MRGISLDLPVKNEEMFLPTVFQVSFMHEITSVSNHFKYGEKVGDTSSHAVYLLCVACLFSFSLSLFTSCIFLQSPAE